MRYLALSGLLLGLLVTGSGCTANRAVTGAPPSVHLESLSRQGMELSLTLIVSNRNDRPLEVEHLALALHFDGEPVIDRQWRVALDIGPRGREPLIVEATALLSGLERLDALGAGEVSRLGYRLTGELAHDGGRRFPVDRTGFLHRVPGQPDRFR